MYPPHDKSFQLGNCDGPDGPVATDAAANCRRPVGPASTKPRGVGKSRSRPRPRARARARVRLLPLFGKFEFSNHGHRYLEASSKTSKVSKLQAAASRKQACALQRSNRL